MESPCHYINKTPGKAGFRETVDRSAKSAIILTKPRFFRGFVHMNSAFQTRSLSAHEGRVVLSLAEHGRREVRRQDVASLLGITLKAADHVIHSLRRKGWLERASWGRYLLIPPDQGPDALGESNLLALASSIVKPYYFGYSTAAAHYGFTTQVRNVIWLVTPVHRRDRRLLDVDVRIVNQSPHRFFGYTDVDVYGYAVKMSDHEKTVIDCLDRPELAGGIAEAAIILGSASGRLNWQRFADYLDRIDARALTQRAGWYVDHVQAEYQPPSVIACASMLEVIVLPSSGRKSPRPTLPAMTPIWRVLCSRLWRGTEG